MGVFNSEEVDSYCKEYGAVIVFCFLCSVHRFIFGVLFEYPYSGVFGLRFYL